MSLAWKSMAWQDACCRAAPARQEKPKKTYKDTVKGNLLWCQLKPKKLEECASYRPQWQATVHQAVATLRMLAARKSMPQGIIMQQ